jgi:hypothetical protein
MVVEDEEPRAIGGVRSFLEGYSCGGEIYERGIGWEELMAIATRANEWSPMSDLLRGRGG